MIESRKNFGAQRKFLFHVLIWPYNFQKNFGANHKWLTSSKFPNFQNGGKSSWCPFSYVGQNSNAYNSYMVGKKYLSRLILAEELGSKIVQISSY